MNFVSLFVVLFTYSARIYAVVCLLGPCLQYIVCSIKYSKDVNITSFLTNLCLKIIVPLNYVVAVWVIFHSVKFCIILLEWNINLLYSDQCCILSLPTRYSGVSVSSYLCCVHVGSLMYNVCCRTMQQGKWGSVWGEWHLV